jgi:hypothetical protein
MGMGLAAGRTEIIFRHGLVMSQCVNKEVPAFFLPLQLLHRKMKF